MHETCPQCLRKIPVLGENDGTIRCDYCGEQFAATVQPQPPDLPEEAPPTEPTPPAATLTLPVPPPRVLRSEVTITRLNIPFSDIFITCLKVCGALLLVGPVMALAWVALAALLSIVLGGIALFG